MKTFTTTELRTDSVAVYNEVHLNDWAKITHRDRPDMVLIKADLVDDMLTDILRNKTAKEA